MPRFILTIVALMLAVGFTGAAAARAVTLPAATGIDPQMELFGAVVPTPRVDPTVELFGFEGSAPRIGPECEPFGIAVPAPRIGSRMEPFVVAVGRRSRIGPQSAPFS